MQHTTWQDIETSKQHRGDRSKDMFYVDRSFAFNASNTLYYLQHMKTKKNASWNLLSEHEFPFDFNVISYVNENGIDEGALTQDFFDKLYSSLSSIITGTKSNNQNGVVLHNERMSDQIIQKAVLALIRVCSLCWRMKVKWKLKSEKEFHEAADFENDGVAMGDRSEMNLVDIDCEFGPDIINPRYFQIAMGKIDRLIENGESKKFIKYISRLADNNLCEIWLPNFVRKYFEDALESEEIEIMIERIDGAHAQRRAMPKNMNEKMELIKDYLFVVSFKGIIQIIEKNLYFFGIVPGHRWLSYNQFYDLMYVEPYFVKEDIQRFVTMIGNDDNWRSDVAIEDYAIQQRLQMCLDEFAQQHFMMNDTNGIQNLLRFWTAKKWTIPKKIEIYIQSMDGKVGTEQDLKYLPRSSACYNKLYLNEYLVRNVEGEFFDPTTDCVRFGELLNLAISSDDGHGFGSF